MRERAGLLDMSSFGKIELQRPGRPGPPPAPRRQRRRPTPPGSVVYTQFLNPRGGIEADLTVVRLGEDRFRVVTGQRFVPGDLGWIRMHLPGDGSVGRSAR